MPLDILEFFFLTPLPGSEDHKTLYLKGVPMDPDMNNYDLEHVCTAHPMMSADVWRQVYRDAWARYYTDEHVETVLRRAVASGIKPRKIADVMGVFSAASASKVFIRCNAGLSGAKCGHSAGMGCRSSIPSCSTRAERLNSLRR